MYDAFFAEIRKAILSAQRADEAYDATAGDDAIADIDNAREAGATEGYVDGLKVAYMMLTGNSLLEGEVN